MLMTKPNVVCIDDGPLQPLQYFHLFLLKHNKCNRLVFELLVDDFASIVLPSFHIVHKPVLIPKV